MVGEREELLDQEIGAVVVVEQPCHQWQQDVGLLYFGAEVCLVDYQDACSPVAFLFGVGVLIWLWFGGIEDEGAWRLKVCDWRMLEAGEAPPVVSIRLVEDGPYRAMRVCA
jgi:hypothetical protein